MTRRNRRIGCLPRVIVVGLAVAAVLKGPEIYDSLDQTQEPVSQQSVSPDATGIAPGNVPDVAASTRAADIYISNGDGTARYIGGCTSSKADIGNRAVMLTAGHCLKPVSNQPVAGLKVGEPVVSSSGRTLEESFTITDAKAAPTGDVAVLAPDQNDPAFAAIPALKVAADFPVPGEVLHVTGYGESSNFSKKVSFSAKFLGEVTGDQLSQVLANNEERTGNYGVIAPIREANAGICEHGISGAPVVDSAQRLHGTISSRTPVDDPGFQAKMKEFLGGQDVAQYGMLCIFDDLAGQDLSA